MRFATVALCSLASVVGLAALPGVRARARADVDPPSKWLTFENKKLGVKVHYPAIGKVTVTGSTLTIAGGELATITIDVTDTDQRASNKAGGATQNQVDWTIDVPKRSAHCHAEAKDNDAAVVASAICDHLELAPGAKHPHVELQVSSNGLADGDGYEKAVRGKQRALDACWTAAVGKDAEIPEGALSFSRDFTAGQAAKTAKNAENFFDHKVDTLSKCAFGVVEGVPAKAAGDAHLAVTMICLLY